LVSKKNAPIVNKTNDKIIKHKVNTNKIILDIHQNVKTEAQIKNQINDFRNALVNLNIRLRNNRYTFITASEIVAFFTNINLNEENVQTLSQVLASTKMKIHYDVDGVKSQSDLLEYLSINEQFITNTVSNKEKIDDVLKKHFTHHVSKAKLLSSAEEKIYTKYLKSTDPKIREIGREKLITSNMRLVVTYATKFNKHGIELEDLIQEGTLGLNRALDSFDYKTGFKFSTYAVW
jgi:RNA polymerase primary sigma factor